MSYELAWAAGLFDGEGTIFAAVAKRRDRSRPNVRLHMALAMTEQTVVQRFAAAVGDGVGRIVYLPNQPPPRKVQWRWQAQAEAEVRAAMDAIWPWLSEPKRAQALRAYDARAAYVAVPAELPPQCRPQERCKRGHDLSVTRYRAPGGGTYCRECQRERRARLDDCPLHNTGLEVAA